MQLFFGGITKLQSYGVAKHVVFYIQKPQFIVIVNILHERMDYIQHISKDM